MSRIWRACARVMENFDENRTAQRLLSIAVYGCIGSGAWYCSGLRPHPPPGNPYHSDYQPPPVED
ncbi:hypothetical protein DCAR_0623424 [Daucus carota subsp. sativus]|uniref:Uncharacterized protein n=1 Tax=Daucus carota subsp. sativus TaxID=79200 RepID=A0A164WRP3_DAUCS|nr:hypothetical protein DCAR_0623424 [Daucus carota subsp. sativus]